MEGATDRREARRPMNSFFIFCKRHRSMVRSKHPNLDNRSISRILGDLWANLGKEEKQQYTATAKQYKDAFMKANPDYKWHSYEKSNLLLNTSSVPTFRDDHPLPASKPNISSDITNKGFNKDSLACYRSCTTNSNNMNLLMMAIEQNATDSTCNHLSQTNIKKELPEISADSPDMSMLLNHESAKVSWFSKINLQPDTENSELRLCQNWGFKNKDITQCSCEPSTNSTQHTVKESSSPNTTDNTTTSPPQHCKDCNESDDCKNHQVDASIDVDWAKSAGLEYQSSFEYPLRDNSIPTRKSKRRNKGAIYKNLIASGALPASRERLAEIQTIYKVTSDDSNDVYDYHQQHRSYEQTGRKLQRTMSESDSQLDKRYKTGDFDLEARIATLPACSMDSLGRSRKNSGKQRICSESSRQTIMSCSTPTIRTDMLLAPPHRRRQPIYPPIVGSRKRKQPRDGIMRIVPLSKEYKHPLANVMKIPLATFYVHPSMKSYQDLQLNKKSDSLDAVTSESEGKDEDCYIASAITPNAANGEENVAAAEALTIDIKCTEESETLKYSENLQPLSKEDSTAAVCTKTGGGILTTPILVTQSHLTFHSNHIPLATNRSLTSNNSNYCCSATYNNNSNINNSSNISYTATCNNNNNSNSFNCSYNASYIKNNNSISTNSCNAGYNNNNSNNNSYKNTFNNNNDNINNNNNNNSCFTVGASSVNIVTHMDNTICSGDNTENSTCPGLEVNQNLHVTGELKVTVEDQSLKRAKLSENPDFKIWISNLAEAAERSGQIPVC